MSATELFTPTQGKYNASACNLHDVSLLMHCVASSGSLKHAPPALQEELEAFVSRRASALGAIGSGLRMTPQRRAAEVRAVSSVLGACMQADYLTPSLVDACRSCITRSASTLDVQSLAYDLQVMTASLGPPGEMLNQRLGDAILLANQVPRLAKQASVGALVVLANAITRIGRMQKVAANPALYKDGSTDILTESTEDDSTLPADTGAWSDETASQFASETAANSVSRLMSPILTEVGRRINALPPHMLRGEEYQAPVKDEIGIFDEEETAGDAVSVQEAANQELAVSLLADPARLCGLLHAASCAPSMESNTFIADRLAPFLANALVRRQEVANETETANLTRVPGEKSMDEGHAAVALAGLARIQFRKDPLILPLVSFLRGALKQRLETVNLHMDDASKSPAIRELVLTSASVLLSLAKLRLASHATAQAMGDGEIASVAQEVADLAVSVLRTQAANLSSRTAASCLHALEMLQVDGYHVQEAAPLYTSLLTSAGRQLRQQGEVWEAGQVELLHQLLTLKPAVQRLGLHETQVGNAIVQGRLRLAEGEEARRLRERRETAANHTHATSGFHREVASVLTPLLPASITVSHEVPVLNGGYSVDLLLTDQQGELLAAVELDGPYHFLFSSSTHKGVDLQGRTHSGPAALKKAAVHEELKGKVVHVGHWEWSALRSSLEDQQMFILDRLAAVGVKL